MPVLRPAPQLNLVRSDSQPQESDWRGSAPAAVTGAVSSAGRRPAGQAHRGLRARASLRLNAACSASGRLEETMLHFTPRSLSPLHRADAQWPPKECRTAIGRAHGVVWLVGARWCVGGTAVRTTPLDADFHKGTSILKFDSIKDNFAKKINILAASLLWPCLVEGRRAGRYRCGRVRDGHAPFSRNIGFESTPGYVLVLVCCSQLRACSRLLFTAGT